MSAPPVVPGPTLTGPHFELAVLCLKHGEASIDFDKIAEELQITKNAAQKRYKRMMEKITTGGTASPGPAADKTDPKTPVSKRKRAPAKSTAKSNAKDEDDEDDESSPTKKPAPRKRAKSSAASAKAKKTATPAKKTATPKGNGFKAVNTPKDGNASDDENDVKTEEDKADVKVKAEVKAEGDGDVKDDAEEED